MDGVTVDPDVSRVPPVFVFGIHCHQPVGQSVDVLDRAVDGSYLPILTTLADFPSFKFCAYFSGALLRQIETRRPGLIDLIKTLAARRQVELLGGAMYDAVLPALSENERIGQIRRFGDYLERLTGTRPKGLWPAEQAWEPQLCRAIRESGMDYVILDDRHIAGAGNTHGVFLTEDSGHPVRLIANHDSLKRMIPGQSVREVLRILEENAAGVMTHVDVAGKFSDAGWLRSFLSAITSSNAVRTLTPSEALTVMEVEGPVYPPAGSSVGVWRSFFSTHPESNWMHKRVSVSQRKMGPVLDKLGTDRESRAIRDLLDRASCHDAYRHGIHVPHLRHAAFANLIEAENRFAKKMGLFPALQSEDVDCDGRPEILVHVAQWVMAIKPSYGGGLIEWSYRPACYNFQNTLTRRADPDQPPVDRKPKRIILFPFGAKDDEEARDTRVSDRYRKCSGLVHAVDPGVSLQDWKNQAVTELAPASGAYEWKTEDKTEFFRIRLSRTSGDFSFEKHIVISKHESKISFSVTMDAKRAGRPSLLGFGFELFYESAEHLTVRVGETEAGGLEGDVRGTGIDIRDEIRRTRFRIAADGDGRQPLRFLLTPSYIFARPDAGAERIFQGLSILMLADAGAESMSFHVEAEQI